ncbi:MAG: OmpA family protein [Acidobacteriaceae bacterium]|jgi:OOP family OmpA-OmpF porin
MEAKSALDEQQADLTPDREFIELRELLLGDQMQKVEELRNRLDDQSVRAGEVSKILAQALSLSIQRDQRISNTLHPVIQHSLRTSVEREPEILATALFPIVGQAVRKAVAHAVEQLLDSLNAIFEDGFSFKRWGWRLEAMRTGKSFAEIALARSRSYRVEQIYLIHRKTGMLLAQASRNTGLMEDADLVVGMLTALQDFARDSFTSTKQDDLEVLQIGEFKVWLLHGPLAILAIVVRGRLPQELQLRFAAKVEQIHKDFHTGLVSFEKDGRPIPGIDEGLSGLLLGQGAAESRSNTKLKIVAGVFFALLLCGALFRVRQDMRWNGYVNKLRQQPGIVVVDARRGWKSLTVVGMRDPLAIEPRALLSEFHLREDQVTGRWEEYLSLDSRLADVRRMNAESDFVQDAVIHFEVNSTQITLDELRRVDELSGQIQRLIKDANARGMAVRFEVVGHTDHTGVEGHNAELSQQRAATVIRLLEERGIDPAMLSGKGVADSQPEHDGTDLYEQALDRRVTFLVRAVPRSSNGN